MYSCDAQDRPVEQTHDDWDQDLNTDLLQLHIPAVTLKNESERMGMMMNELFSEVESDFGDGFFNAVLFEKLAEVGLASAGPVSEKLKYIHVYKAHKGGRSYAECASKIDSVIAGCARSLTELLRYEESEAKPVLEDAIAYYLDERFSITDRKRLGLR